MREILASEGMRPAVYGSGFRVSAMKAFEKIGFLGSGIQEFRVWNFGGRV